MDSCIVTNLALEIKSGIYKTGKLMYTHLTPVCIPLSGRKSGLPACRLGRDGWILSTSVANLSYVSIK